MSSMKSRISVLSMKSVLFLMLSLPILAVAGPQKKALTVQDIMKFKQIRGAVISDDGTWIAYATYPDRGNGEVVVQKTTGKQVYQLERGNQPVFSRDSKWVATTILPKASESQKKDEEKKPKKGLGLLNMSNGVIVRFENVETFRFSEDSRWLAIKHGKKEEDKAEKKDGSERDGRINQTHDADGILLSPDETEDGKKKKILGTRFVLLPLKSDEPVEIPFVHQFAIDSLSRYLAYSTADTMGHSNGLYMMDLDEESYPRTIVDFHQNAAYSHLEWNNRRNLLAFLSGTMDKEERVDSTALWIWSPDDATLVGIVTEAEIQDEWFIPAKNDLRWTTDGNRLFFGLKPESERIEEEKADEDTMETEEDLYDVDRILKKREVDVWHWDDPLINPNQKKEWPEWKDKTYRTVYHLERGEFERLADESLPEVTFEENTRYVMGTSDIPHRKLRTWEGFFQDVYSVSLEDGSRRLIKSRLEERARLSPHGKFIVYYDDKHWHLADCGTGETRNLTGTLGVPFYNEDHDYPQPAPGYGIGGWIGDDEAVLIYDKYDIWEIDTHTGEAFNLTNGLGREQKVTFRTVRWDQEKRTFLRGDEVLLSAYHHERKHTAFYSCAIGSPGVQRRLEYDKTLHFLAKARHDPRFMFTRQSYTEFPDIWVSDTSFRPPKKITDVNPQISEFAWGSAELVEWNSVDGIPLHGIFIRPDNVPKGQRLPVLVYFYRFFSQRLHLFNQTVINHRPCFPFYASHGYAVFLPDIRFDIGQPGYAATKCLVPGIQKLIDMGIADPDAVALHGHSWSGYQTAHVITQTNIFKCAIAGAPVSNMTSAYSGIRWGSGLARQFQYEQQQSRIGGDLWEALPLYIENSPVFFANRIQTPLLIMFGDEDGAVPWYQGIELYLAMRRLEKDCIFLQYRGEPHHPQKYPNKLDYTLKMKQYLDYYLKGEEPADWIVKGVPYRGK